MEVSNKVFRRLIKKLKRVKFDKELYELYSKYENDFDDLTNE